MNWVRLYSFSSNFWNRFIIWSDDIFEGVDFGTTEGDFWSEAATSLAQLALAIPYGFFRNRLFIFKINPQQMDVEKKRSFKEVLTAGGPEVSIGKDQMTSYKLTVSTGPLLPPRNLYKVGLRDQWFSSNWRRFETFQRFWEESQNKSAVMHMIFDREYTRGHLTGFSFSRKAEDPWEIIMNMELLVYPTGRFSLLTTLPTPVLELANVADTFFNSNTEYF
jgi:hypothetical protein